MGGFDSRSNSPEKDKEGVIRGVNQNRDIAQKPRGVPNSAMPYASLEFFTEELLCAKHFSRSLVDLVQLTLRDIMLTKTNPQRGKEIRNGQLLVAILGGGGDKRYLLHI